MKLLQTLLDGLTVGCLYALIALGYTMVYGILKFINFAHSDIFALGVWMSITIAGWIGAGAETAPAWYIGLLVLAGAMITCGLVGFTVERIAYRPLRGAHDARRRGRFLVRSQIQRAGQADRRHHVGDARAQGLRRGRRRRDRKRPGCGPGRHLDRPGRVLRRRLPLQPVP